MGKPSHEVIFDGRSLVFPNGYVDRESIQQAARNAKTLGDWLSGSGSSKVHVEAVVAIPGWMVARKGKGDVKVLSGKELFKHIPKIGSSSLDDETARQIASRIEDHCRDVEGE